MNGHVLSMRDLSADDVTKVLDTAGSFREVGTRVIKKVPALRGRTVVNLFMENSTRTRISFELAAKRLSADVINFSASGSSVSKGESLKDTALTLQAMGADAIVIRHGSSGAPAQLTRWVDAHVLNAGDGTHEHPTQALLDLYTMREKLGRLGGLRVAIVGDVLHSRVARSLSFGLATMGADVTLLDTDLDKLRLSFWRYNNRVHGLASSKLAIQQQVSEADLVIGAVLIPGAKAPKLVSNDLVAQMKPGSVLVDIAVDQGGCFEDTRPTTHADPTFQVHGSTFYCVANMPGAVPNTSTYALTNATLPYVVALADKGWQEACRADQSLALGLNTHAGRLTNAPVGDAPTETPDDTPVDSV